MNRRLFLLQGLIAAALAVPTALQAMPVGMAGSRYVFVNPGDITTPGAPEVVGAGPTTLYMRWNAPTISTGELFYQYKIYRSTSAGGTYTLCGVSSVNAFVDSGRPNSTTYYYKVECQDEALNTSNLSAASNGMATLASGARSDYPTWVQEIINTRYVLPTGGTTHTPTTVALLQTAIDNAALGDVISISKALTLDLNTATGNQLVLKNKTTGSGWIYIVSSDVASLPAPGTRVAAADASNMPTLKVNTSATGNVGIATENTAHHYRFVGINFVCTSAGSAPNRPIEIGQTSISSEANLPHHITFDRCIWSGDATYGGIHGMAINGTNVAVIDSRGTGWSDFANGNDSQAIWISNTNGPIKIHNSRLEGGSENIMAGGDSNLITNIVPSDMDITNNHLIKPIAWADGGTGAGSCKNLLEIKNGQRVLIANNTLENFWAGGQAWCLSLKSTDQDGTSNWCRCTDVAVIYNHFKNVSAGPTIHGRNGSTETTPTTRTTIRDNIIEVTGLDSSGGYTATSADGYFLNGSPDDSVFEHNTVLLFGSNTGRVSIYFGNEGGAYGRFDGDNNLIVAMSGGMIKDANGGGSGTAGLATNFVSSSATKNVFIGGSSTGMPAGNFYPANNEAVGFVGTIGSSPPSSVSDYALTSGSAYHNAGTDGYDVGADVARLAA